MKPHIQSAAISAAAVGGLLAGAVLTTATPAAAIIGGTDATNAPRPVVALRVDLGDGRGGICGAVLVRDPRSGKIGAVTSAVCATVPGHPTPLPATGLTVLAGSPLVSQATPIPATGTVVPAGWAWGDGAPARTVQAWSVVRIPQTRGLHAMPIAAAPRTQQRVTLMGWGALHPTDTSQPDMAQQLGGRVVAASNCAAGSVPISSDEFCVGSPPETGITRGDAGNPGMVRTDCGWEVAGVVSRIDETTGAAILTTLGDYREEIYAAIRGEDPAHRATATPAAPGVANDTSPWLLPG